jgi:hypothetical protein
MSVCVVLCESQKKRIKKGRELFEDPHLQLEHLQEFAKFYLANLVFGQLLKRYAK